MKSLLYILKKFCIPQSRIRASRGFTLLLAALVASIVLSLGGSIFTIAQKQVTLSSVGRDSQFAFYAADTGAECALYWDIRAAAFATSSESSEMQSISCDGVSIVPEATESDSDSAVTTFLTDLFTENVTGETQPGNCVEVTIEKNPTNPFTVIHADGYSVDCASRDTSPRSLQRSVELSY